MGGVLEPQPGGSAQPEPGPTTRSLTCWPREPLQQLVRAEMQPVPSRSSATESPACRPSSPARSSDLCRTRRTEPWTNRPPNQPCKRSSRRARPTRTRVARSAWPDAIAHHRQGRAGEPPERDVREAVTSVVKHSGAGAQGWPGPAFDAGVRDPRRVRQGPVDCRTRDALVAVRGDRSQPRIGDSRQTRRAQSCRGSTTGERERLALRVRRLTSLAVSCWAAVAVARGTHSRDRPARASAGDPHERQQSGRCGRNPLWATRPSPYAKLA